MADEHAPHPEPTEVGAPEAVVTVDAEGNVVEAGDPRAARILRGPEAQAVLDARRGPGVDRGGAAPEGHGSTPPAAPEPDAAPEADPQGAGGAERKARKAPPEDKGA